MECYNSLIFQDFIEQETKEAIKSVCKIHAG